ncbi:hypothetical protein I203_103306 [Kwoniella mangroviensis CBS 8507]|uniref:uncharacterized protein n=1 Tax=Kwoniella mangroviensis CBS 8507 TaxID=1296122 RepID=UPI00306E1D0E
MKLSYIIHQCLRLRFTSLVIVASLLGEDVEGLPPVDDDILLTLVDGSLDATEANAGMFRYDGLSVAEVLVAGSLSGALF